MSVILVTGSAGLIGSETARFFHGKGFDVVGIDNDMRRYFFGDGASTRWNRERLENDLPNYRHLELDIRDEARVGRVFKQHGSSIEIIVHAAAQPSHDWAAREPLTDFSVNANGTLVLLEAMRTYAPEACFVFVSTNKVYGDLPNKLPLVEHKTRWELDPSHVYHDRGIDETMSIDQCMHSLFGASKAAADLMVQEYGRYFGLKTGIFRGGCLTGGGHSGTELHGFLSYLVRCCLEGHRYTIFGYKGKQVRDNIHSLDLVEMFWHFCRAPRIAEVYNAGGSRHSDCSMLEAISLAQEMTGRELDTRYTDQHRVGDHIWYISDVSKFQQHYPKWSYRYDLEAIVQSVVRGWQDRSKPA